VALAAEDAAAADRHGAKTDKIFTVRLSRKAATWRNVVALSWCRAGQQPSKVSLESRGQVWSSSRTDAG